jgi:Uma2 family endonuclease
MPLDPHESYKKLLGRLIEAATEELDIEIRSLGSRTCDREDLAKGLEPDQCYYIQNEAIVRGIEQINLSFYPPPDLALEIDITSSSVNRMSIYAALGIPEIWRFDGAMLTMMELREGRYVEIPFSVVFSMLKPDILMSFIDQRINLGENAIVKQFRQWMREH